MTSSYEVMAAALAQILNTEFAAEGIIATHDNLHDALGRNSREVGIAPVEDVVNTRNATANETWAEVKFYDFWKQEISPSTAVDPRVITNYAERFRRACRAAIATDPHTGVLWYFDVVRVQYPNDPTGNKSRFVATVKGYGNNSGLVETTG
jgi:hypothetical protein